MEVTWRAKVLCLSHQHVVKHKHHVVTRPARFHFRVPPFRVTNPGNVASPQDVNMASLDNLVVNVAIRSICLLRTHEMRQRAPVL